MAALAVVALPQVFHLSPWVTGLSAALGLWRLGNIRRGWPLLGRYARIIAAFAVLVSVWLSYRTLNGPDAGTALLLLLAALKLMEADTPRDYFLLLLIAYFIAIANFLDNQSIALALYTLAALWLITAALLAVSQPEVTLRPRRALAYTARLFLPALPIAALLFVLFPRIPGPLWGLGFDGSAVSGLANTMQPGSISHLVQSDQAVFRVSFAGPIPPPRQRYWRGLVLHHFDGTVWSRGAPVFQRQPGESKPHGTPIRYTVTLEPNRQRWLFTLKFPAAVPLVARLLSDDTLVSRTPIRKLYRYTVVSRPGHPARPKLDADERRRDLQLPAHADPRARALAKRWQAGAASPRGVIEKALALFHNQPFVYTLNPPALGKNSIDAFLFASRRGFCEHYAGAFTFLMRAAGIPARVVVGYQGGEINPLGGYLIVRQADAHAWSEVWLAGQGWVRVDPTAAVAPSRVEDGLAGTLPGGAHSAGFSLGPRSWIRDLQFSWDALDNGWNQWILGYGPALQKRFFSGVGLRYGHWTEVGIVLTLAVLVVMGLVVSYWLWRARPQPSDPAARLYQRFCRRLARAGLPRAGHEGPLDFGARIARARPELGAEVEAITQRYVALRYEAQAGEQALREFRRHVAHFKPHAH
jgi:transglutaminase-like putative cysteine protease